MELGARVRAATRAAIGRAAARPGRRRAHWGWCLGLTVGPLVIAEVKIGVANAQTTGSATDPRSTLLADAEAARTAGDHARALELAQRAALIRMSPSLALMIAQEATTLGRALDGLVAARRCVSDASADVALRNRERILRLCTALVEQLGTRVGEVTVRTTALPEGTRIELGHRVLPQEAWGIAVPAEPGDVEVRATSPDGRTFTRTLRVGAGERAEVAVAFPAERTASPPPRTTTVLDARAGSTREELRPRRGVGAGPWVLGGIGALAFASAGVFWALHGSAVAERDAMCDRTGCDPSSVAANERARDFTVATNVAFAVGGASLAAGLVWWIVAWSRRDGAGNVIAAPVTAWVAPSVAGVAVGGAL